MRLRCRGTQASCNIKPVEAQSLCCQLPLLPATFFTHTSICLNLSAWRETPSLLYEATKYLVEKIVDVVGGVKRCINIVHRLPRSFANLFDKCCGAICLFKPPLPRSGLEAYQAQRGKICGNPCRWFVGFHAYLCVSVRVTRKKKWHSHRVLFLEGC